MRCIILFGKDYQNKSFLVEAFCLLKFGFAFDIAIFFRGFSREDVLVAREFDVLAVFVFESCCDKAVGKIGVA